MNSLKLSRSMPFPNIASSTLRDIPGSRGEKTEMEAHGNGGPRKCAHIYALAEL
jgi:hypothetical protein